MIIDIIDNIEKYNGLGYGIYSALKYVAATEFDNIKPGRHDIHGDKMFAIVSDYITKHSNECRLEAHRKYIDVQYMVNGIEWVGYAPLKDQALVAEYDTNKDCAFFSGQSSFIRLEKGMFAIFFPQDLHMPGTGDIPAPVRKVVVKVRI